MARGRLSGAGFSTEVENPNAGTSWLRKVVGILRAKFHALIPILWMVAAGLLEGSPISSLKRSSGDEATADGGS